MKIFGIGTVVVDHVVDLPRFPERDTKVGVDRHWKQIGGPVPVALSTAAKYGSDCCFMGRWGDDEAGRTIRTGLQSRGIDLSASTSNTEWSTGFAHVWTEAENGTRTIAFSRGEFPLPNAADVEANLPDNITLLHLDGWAAEAAIAAAVMVKQHGGMVTLDAGSFKPGMEKLLPHVDLLIASALFRKSRFGTADVPTDDLLGLGVQAVVTTDGEQSARYASTDEEFQQQALTVDAVDTNGAGDIFSGALIHAIAVDWPMREAVRFATVVAGWSCTQRGNESLPTSEQVSELTDRV